MRQFLLPFFLIWIIDCFANEEHANSDKVNIAPIMLSGVPVSPPLHAWDLMPAQKFKLKTSIYNNPWCLNNPVTSLAIPVETNECYHAFGHSVKYEFIQCPELLQVTVYNDDHCFSRLRSAQIWNFHCVLSDDDHSMKVEWSDVDCNATSSSLPSFIPIPAEGEAANTWNTVQITDAIYPSNGCQDSPARSTSVTFKINYCYPVAAGITRNLEWVPGRCGEVLRVNVFIDNYCVDFYGSVDHQNGVCALDDHRRVYYIWTYSKYDCSPQTNSMIVIFVAVFLIAVLASAAFWWNRHKRKALHLSTPLLASPKRSPFQLSSTVPLVEKSVILPSLPEQHSYALF